MRDLRDFPIAQLVAFIDWGPFFHAWEFRGSYPNLLRDPHRGAAARKLFDDAQAMLHAIIQEGWLTAQAVYGFFSANADGEDIAVFEDERRDAVRARLPMLRQQEKKRLGGPYFSLADYVAPRGYADYIGAFALTAGLGADEKTAAFKDALDDYNAILLQALADRLARGICRMPARQGAPRLGIWPGRSIEPCGFDREKYRGIRPAPGYPACPDHTEKRALFDLLCVEQETDIHLTETFAMWPAASVSGWYFAHPDARYFAVGKIDADQVTDYARRKGMSIAEAERWLAPNLGYK